MAGMVSLNMSNDRNRTRALTHSLSPYLFKRSPRGPWLCAHHSTSFFWAHFSATLQVVDCCQWECEGKWCSPLPGKALESGCQISVPSLFSKGTESGGPGTAGGEPWGCFRQRREQETDAHCTKPLRSGFLLLRQRLSYTNTDRNLEYGRGGIVSQRGRYYPKDSRSTFTLRGQKSQNPCLLTTLKCIWDGVKYKKWNHVRTWMCYTTRTSVWNIS